jgi:hypothetical protein
MLGIMANIARKVDRLGGSATNDETSADTATDLLIYLVKYQSWLENKEASDTPDRANLLLEHTEILLKDKLLIDKEATEDYLRKSFDMLELAVTGNLRDKRKFVVDMIAEAYRLARYLWEQEQSNDYRGADVD